MRYLDLAPIPGDPAGMRAAAAAIEKRAAELDRLSSRIGKQTAKMEFRAKAGTRTKSEVARMTGEAAGQAAIMTVLASQIRTRADGVERAQRERAALLERMRQQEMAAMRRAA